jgi:7-keto-8-aminopelargonate synthetase-like enzyme
MTEPDSVQQVNRTYVRYRGRTLSYFTGCDYFRLSTHPTVQKAVTDGLKKFGLNVAASRRTTGNHAVYLELEDQLAKFFQAKSALLVSSGYTTVLAAAQSLASTFSHALLDDRTHTALVDAANLLNCPVLKFKHRDAADFERTLNRCGRGARPIALTDGMFSYDGSVAPLAKYLKLLPRDSMILVDDAHGGGTIGKHGRGAIELAGVKDDRIVQCVTLSKAFGCYGGAILASKKLRERIVTTSPMFMGSTPLPLPLAYAGLAAIKLLRNDQTFRARLNRNSHFVKQSLRDAGAEIPTHPGPIIPFPLPKQANARLHRALLAAKIFPSFIRYGNGPTTGYFRFVVSSEHTQPQLDSLVAILKEFIA